MVVILEIEIMGVAYVVEHDVGMVLVFGYEWGRNAGFQSYLGVLDPRFVPQFIVDERLQRKATAFDEQ